MSPFRSTESPVSKRLTAGRLMSELQTLTGTCKNHRVVTHHISASHAVHSNFLIGARTHYSFTTVPKNFFLLISNLKKDFTERCSRAAGSIHLLAMMHLDDLKVNSARLVDVIIAFEDDFDIEIADEDVDSVNSVGDAVNLILAKL